MNRMLKSRRMKLDRHVSRMGRTFLGNKEENRRLERQRRGWANNNKIYLRKTGRGSMDWFHLALDKDQ
jgi:hypothetical protein